MEAHGLPQCSLKENRSAASLYQNDSACGSEMSDSSPSNATMLGRLPDGLQVNARSNEMQKGRQNSIFLKPARFQVSPSVFVTESKPQPSLLQPAVFRVQASTVPRPPSVRSNKFSEGCSTNTSTGTNSLNIYSMRKPKNSTVVQGKRENNNILPNNCAPEEHLPPNHKDLAFYMKTAPISVPLISKTCSSSRKEPQKNSVPCRDKKLYSNESVQLSNDEQQMPDRGLVNLVPTTTPLLNNVEIFSKNRSGLNKNFSPGLTYFEKLNERFSSAISGRDMKMKLGGIYSNESVQLSNDERQMPDRGLVCSVPTTTPLLNNVKTFSKSTRGMYNISSLDRGKREYLEKLLSEMPNIHLSRSELLTKIESCPISMRAVLRRILEPYLKQELQTNSSSTSEKGKLERILPNCFLEKKVPVSADYVTRTGLINDLESRSKSESRLLEKLPLDEEVKYDELESGHITCNTESVASKTATTLDSHLEMHSKNVGDLQQNFSSTSRDKKRKLEEMQPKKSRLFTCNTECMASTSTTQNRDLAMHYKSGEELLQNSLTSSDQKRKLEEMRPKKSRLFTCNTECMASTSTTQNRDLAMHYKSGEELLQNFLTSSDQKRKLEEMRPKKGGLFTWNTECMASTSTTQNRDLAMHYKSGEEYSSCLSSRGKKIKLEEITRGESQANSSSLNTRGKKNKLEESQENSSSSVSRVKKNKLEETLPKICVPKENIEQESTLKVQESVSLVPVATKLGDDADVDYTTASTTTSSSSSTSSSTSTDSDDDSSSDENNKPEEDHKKFLMDSFLSSSYRQVPYSSSSSSSSEEEIDPRLISRSKKLLAQYKAEQPDYRFNIWNRSSSELSQKLKTALDELKAEEACNKK